MAAAQQQAQQQVAFALAPALAQQGILDFNDVGDKKLYHKAIAPLSEDLYDLSATDLTVFLYQVDDRAVEYGWEGILSIPEDVNVPPPNNNLRMLTTQYGQITLTQIEEHADTYINAQDRDAQNSFMLYSCLMNSLNKKAQATVRLETAKFTRDGVGVGALLLKVIIARAYVDTRSTTLQIRNQLSSLDTYMVEVKHNVDLFNDHVRTLHDGLAARGEQSLDLISNLFKGYMSSTDQDFKDFIKRKKDAYEEGDIDLTHTDLMDKASNKYNALVAAGTWNKASEDQEKIIALQTKLSQLEKKSKAWKSAPTSKGNDNPSKKGKTTNENKKNPTWVRTAPKEGESQSRKWGNKDWYWCAHHAKWSPNPKHTTQTCRGDGIDKTNVKDKEKKKDGQHPKDSTPKLKLSRALVDAQAKDSDSD